MFRKNISYKIVAVLSLLFSTLALIIAYKNPMQGYELSIYSSTPLIVWLSLAISVLGGLLVIIYQIVYDKYLSSNFWMMGAFLLLYNRLIILYIPYIRGYFSWRGDNITHIGYLISIMQNGHVPSDNIYPITHLILSSIYTIASVPIEIVVNYSTALFSLFYVISIFLLAQAIFNSKKVQILAFTSVAVVFFSYNLYLMPNGWSQLYLPLAIFFYFKSLEKTNSLQYTILFVILLIMYPYFHPLSSLYLIFVLFIIAISIVSVHIFSNSLEKPNTKKLREINTKSMKRLSISRFITFVKDNLDYINETIKNKKYQLPLTAILLETVIVIIWMLSFNFFHVQIRIIYESILTGTSVDAMGSMQDTLNKINITGFDFIELLIKIEGANLIFLMLFGISLILLIKNKHNIIENKNIIILSAITIFTGLIYASYLFGIGPTHAEAAQRMKSYILIFTPVSAGFLFCYLFQKRIKFKKINVVPIICILIIFSASMLSIFSQIPDPYTNRPTPSITQMDMEGTEWFVEYHKQGVLTTHIMSPIYRFTDGVIGTYKRNIMLGSRYRHTHAPDHFNYTIHENIGLSYSEDKYMMLTKYDTIIYDTVWEAVDRFDSADFEKLEDDDSVRKLYSNGETKAYYISSKNYNLR